MRTAFESLSDAPTQMIGYFLMSSVALVIHLTHMSQQRLVMGSFDFFLAINRAILLFCLAALFFLLIYSGSESLIKPYAIAMLVSVAIEAANALRYRLSLHPVVYAVKAVVVIVLVLTMVLALSLLIAD